MTTETKVTGLTTSITYTANGTQKVFSVPFDYLRSTFVYVEVNGVAAADYMVINRTVELDTAPAQGSLVYIYRSTPTERLVSWADASVLKASDMTVQQTQILHITEEQWDWAQRHSMVLENEVAWDARNYRITNLADPINPKDAVTKDYFETMNKQYLNESISLRDETAKLAQETAEAAGAAKLSEDSAKANAEAAKEYMDNSYIQAESAENSALEAARQAEIAQALAAEAKRYDASITYQPSDVVMLPNGDIYRCIVTSTGENPATSQKWVAVSQVVSKTFEADEYGDLMPLVYPKTSTNWDVDLSGDIMPSELEGIEYRLEFDNNGDLQPIA